VGNTLDRISKFVSTCLVGLAAFTLVAWVVVIAVFVTARSVFNVQWMFVEEYTGYCMVLLTSFSFAYALRQGAHITVSVVADNVPEKMKKPLKVFADLVALVVVLYLTGHSIKWLMEGISGGARSWFPSRTLLWPVYSLIPIGLGALALEFLNQLVSSVKSLRETESR
jgi:TRAP-type C4-dicarboxylate transport system permease small subunit